jgi:hypothetical protein
MRRDPRGLSLFPNPRTCSSRRLPPLSSSPPSQFTPRQGHRHRHRHRLAPTRARPKTTSVSRSVPLVRRELQPTSNAATLRSKAKILTISIVSILKFVFLPFSVYNVISNLSQVDGHLTQDHDAGLCPGAAVQDCSPTRRRRRNALPRSPRPAGPGARSPKPEVMKTRSKLAAMKRGLAN